MVIVTKFILQHNIAAENNIFGSMPSPYRQWRLMEMILVLVLLFIPFLLVFFPIVWPS
jgi:hypothetical protein